MERRLENKIISEKSGNLYSGNQDNIDREDYHNNSLDSKKTQWHMALAPALKLEFKDYKDILQYNREYTLNTKALQIDLLIIKKNADIVIENEIGKIFKTCNVIEYKSPRDSLGVDAYLKTYAYACLYKIYADGGKQEIEDITITMIRKSKPAALFNWFRAHGREIEKKYEGIYYIKDAGFLETQVIVLNEVSDEMHLWVKALTDNLNEQQAQKLITESKKLLEATDAEYAESVLQVAVKGNRDTFGKIKEMGNMYSALVELMQPEIDAAVDAAVGAAVDATEEKGVVTAVENVMKKLKMPEEEACTVMDITVETYRKYKENIKNRSRKTISQ